MQQCGSSTLDLFAVPFLLHPLGFVLFVLPQPAAAQSLGKGSATSLISVVQRRGQMLVFHPEPGQAQSGRSLGNIAWHSSEVLCKGSGFTRAFLSSMSPSALVH